MRPALTALALAWSVVSGCATVHIPKGQPFSQHVVVLKDYVVGEVKIVSTGSVMLEKTGGPKLVTLEITTATGVVPPVAFGFGPVARVRSEFSFWTPDPDVSGGFYFMSPLILSDTAQLEAIRAYKDGKGPPVVFRNHKFNAWTNLTTAEPVPPNELVTRESVDELGAARIQLLYNGKRGDNVIVLTYREFQGGFARPAFYQELSYDLKESAKISFRNYVIRVLEATNNSVTFVIEKE